MSVWEIVLIVAAAIFFAPVLFTLGMVVAQLIVLAILFVWVLIQDAFDK